MYAMSLLATALGLSRSVGEARWPRARRSGDRTAEAGCWIRDQHGSTKKLIIALPDATGERLSGRYRIVIWAEIAFASPWRLISDSRCLWLKGCRAIMLHPPEAKQLPEQSQQRGMQ